MENSNRNKKRIIHTAAVIVLIFLFCSAGMYVTHMDTVDPDVERKGTGYQIEKDIYIDGILFNNWELDRPFIIIGSKGYAPVDEEFNLDLKKRKDSGCHFEDIEISCGTHYEYCGIPADLDDVAVDAEGNMYAALRYLKKIGRCSIDYDVVTGYYVSRDENITASEYLKANPNKSYIEGRKAYICFRNSNVSHGDALYYEYLFRHCAACEKYAEEDMLMSVSFVESRFTENIGTNAVGLMQVLVKYALRKGYTLEELYDPHVNIHYGAFYISERIDYFGGDESVALTAYNKGLAAVLLSGIRESEYARKVLSEREYMKAWILKNGYSNEFVTEIVLE